MRNKFLIENKSEGSTKEYKKISEIVKDYEAYDLQYHEVISMLKMADSKKEKCRERLKNLSDIFTITRIL